MAFVVVIPIAEVLAEAAVVAWRAYRLYRTAQALEGVITAQESAKDDADAKSSEKTDAQAKADDAASCVGGNCEPDPNCAKWRENIKRALYDVKQPKAIGGAGGGGKGVLQRLCEWEHGTLPGGAGHKKSIEESFERMERNLKNLKDTRHFRCPNPKDLEDEVEKAEKEFERIQESPHAPRGDFQEFCYARAMGTKERMGLK